MANPDDWEIRVERAWSTASRRPDGEVFDELARLADERNAEDPVALYELASAHDYVGREADAVPLYRQALAQGLHGSRRPRALLQLASSLRNLGLAGEAIELLAPDEVPDAGFSSEGLTDARAAFLALALADVGQHRAAVGIAVTALARHCGEYASVVRRGAETPPVTGTTSWPDRSGT